MFDDLAAILVTSMFQLTRRHSTALVPPLEFHGLWLSLVERFVRDEEAAGSNPASPTTRTAYLLWRKAQRKSPAQQNPPEHPLSMCLGISDAI